MDPNWQKCLECLDSKFQVFFSFLFYQICDVDGVAIINKVILPDLATD
jgi:hypothetical protein